MIAFIMAFPLIGAGRAFRSYSHKALGAGPVSAAIPNAGRWVQTKKRREVSRLYSYVNS